MADERLNITGNSLWSGVQGWEYLDLKRFWQILLIMGLFFWVIMLYRVLRGRLKSEKRLNLPGIFFCVALAILAFYAVGLALFCLRYLIPADRWSDKAAETSFWMLNIGLAWTSFVTLFPLGIIQLYHSVSEGYFEARSLDFLYSHSNTLIEWLRLPGDMVFIIGILPILYLVWQGMRHRVAKVTREEPQKVLFTEIRD